MARKIRTLTDAGTREAISIVDEALGGTNQSTYNTGDLLYSDGTNSLDKLPIGSEGYILTSSAGTPEWKSPSEVISSIIDIIRVGKLDTLTAGVTRYLLPNFSEATNDDFIGYLIDGYGMLTNMAVLANVAPGSGENVVFTVTVNGVDSLLATSLVNTNTTDQNSGSISVSPGDKISVKAVSSAGSVAADIQISITYEKMSSLVGEDAMDIITVGKIGIVTPNVTRYMLPNFAESSTENFTAYLANQDGYIDHLRIYADTAPGLGENVTVTIRVNGADTAITATLSDTNQEANDLVNMETIVAGSRITIKSVSSTSSIAANIFITCRYAR